MSEQRSRTKSQLLIESSDSTRKLNGYVPSNLFLEFKSRAAAHDITMTDLLVELMAKWIDEDDANGKEGNKLR